MRLQGIWGFIVLPLPTKALRARFLPGARASPPILEQLYASSRGAAPGAGDLASAQLSHESCMRLHRAYGAMIFDRDSQNF